MLRKIFPRTLLFRSLLIVIAPIILIQIVVGGVFFDSIWYKTNRGLVRSAANEINTFLALYPEFKQKNKSNELINIYKDKSGIIISIKKETQQLPSTETVKWYSLYDKIVLEEFSDKIKNLTLCQYGFFILSENSSRTILSYKLYHFTVSVDGSC